MENIDSLYSINYYNENADKFKNDTQQVDFSEIQNRFMNLIKKNGNILDLGCGSGRDTKVFIDNGFKVTAIDGSIEMCKIAAAYTNKIIINSDFISYEPREKFDGIWACSSILHLNKKDLKNVIDKYINVLNDDGYFYMSFKYGDYSGVRNNRFFTDFYEESFKEFINDIKNVYVYSIDITNDVRDGRENEKWLNIILKHC